VIGCVGFAESVHEFVVSSPDIEPRVSVALANWNGIGHLGRCLDAVYSQSLPVQEVVVVDNGSADGSPDLVERQYPEALLIRRPANEGFCKGYNLAIRNTCCPLVLILNTDVFLDRGFLCESVRAICASPDIGAVAAQVHRASTGEVEYVGRFLRPWMSLTNGAGMGPDREVFAGSGSVFLCRREALDDVRWGAEYYDEDFFAYLEDLDLFWRLRLRQWRCVYVPGAQALHIGSASQGGRVRVVEKPASLQRHIWKNRYLVLTKNASLALLCLLLPWMILHESAYWAYLLVRLPHRLPVFFLAHMDYLRLLPSALTKRRAIQERAGADLRTTVRFIRWIWPGPT